MSMLTAIMKKSDHFLVYLSLLLLIFVFSTGCSIEKNRKILTLFFDGVPVRDKGRKNDKPDQNSEQNKEKSSKPLEFRSHHPDHKARECSKCHSRNSDNFLVTEKRKICFVCHKKDDFSGRFVHGPVAAGACQSCHEPHHSVNDNLLISENRDLCLSCHDIHLNSSEHGGMEKNCLECHDPHKEENRFFLKGNIKNRDGMDEAHGRIVNDIEEE